MSRRDNREGWGSDGFFFTEAGRGGPLTWRPGAEGFAQDALGPVRHAHDDAGEYYYMVAGSLRAEVGGEELTLEAGDLCFVPPDAPHNALGPASDAEVRMFCVVAPNLVDAKWRIDDFRPGSDSLRAMVGRPFEDPGLPGDESLRAQGLTLDAGDGPRTCIPEGHERVYLVVDGELAVKLHGGLQGTLHRDTYLHLREGVEHELSTTTRCQVLQIDCAFKLWANVALPDTGAA